MAKYRKADNCGPVPWPDRSGKFLKAGETAEGDGWEALIPLGYVVKIDEPKAPAPVVAAPVAAKTEAAKPAKVEVSNAKVDDRTRVEEVDFKKAGVADNESVPGRTPA